jgi:hypothetical protein
MENEVSPSLRDEFDNLVRRLTGLPDTVSTKPSTVTTVTPLVNQVTTWIVQTYRRSERNEAGVIVKSGDIIFLQYIDASGGKRFVIPPDVADAIARQRDALGTKNRKRAARANADRRKAAGVKPNFTKRKKP